MDETGAAIDGDPGPCRLGLGNRNHIVAAQNGRNAHIIGQDRGMGRLATDFSHNAQQVFRIDRCHHRRCDVPGDQDQSLRQRTDIWFFDPQQEIDQASADVPDVLGPFAKVSIF